MTPKRDYQQQRDTPSSVRRNDEYEYSYNWQYRKPIRQVETIFQWWGYGRLQLSYQENWAMTRLVLSENEYVAPQHSQRNC